MSTLAPTSPFSLTQYGRATSRDDDPASDSGAFEPAPTEGPLRDRFGRIANDLRLSITDRCNFRCSYCLSPDAQFLPSESRLSTQEIIQLGRTFARLGVERLRITGGEPTLHPDLCEIISELSPLYGDVSMTTNGSRLTEATAKAWKAAGLKRITISIDSVDPARFRAVSRSNLDPAVVIDGIRAAIGAGLGPVKVNAVLLVGVNDEDAPALAELARALAIEIRFIEFMPLDADGSWNTTRVVSSAKTIERISDVFPLIAEGRDRPDRTAVRFRFADGSAGSVGTIAPVSDPFCGECSRIRVTPDGFLRPCLLANSEWPIRHLLKGRGSDEAIEAAIREAIWNKDRGGALRMGPMEGRTMSAIGG